MGEFCDQLLVFEVLTWIVHGMSEILFFEVFTLVMHGRCTIVDGDRGGRSGGRVGDVVCRLLTHTPTTTADDANHTYDEHDHTPHCDRYSSRHTQRQELF